MSTSDGDGLRAAILAQPDDDTLRLIYADWLQENDQPDRAAFVRAQVAIAQAEPFGPQFRERVRAADKLQGAHPEWGQHVRQKHRALSGWFARGFIERVHVDAASFPRHAAELFAAEPVRSVQVTRFASPAGGTVSLVPFFQVPELDRVTRLDLTGLQLSESELELLADAPELVNLTDLCLRGNAVQPVWLGELLTGLAMPALAGLDLHGLVNHGPRLATVLPLLNRRLLRLDLGHIPFTSEQIKSMLESRCLREVEELRLAWMTGAGRAGVMTHLNLGWTIPWNRLRILDLSSQGVGDQGVKEIVLELTRRREPAPLRWLGLANNGIGAEGVRELVRSDPERVKLYYLDLRLNNLTLSQRAALQTRFPEAVIRYDGAE
ncbi:MAG: TIGR02996 domain-containing protein [Planctomycetes bacterium]|nr:TIGR02996 domain-containing protein [Planctomycetota bacterium]